MTNYGSRTWRQQADLTTVNPIRTLEHTIMTRHPQLDDHPLVPTLQVAVPLWIFKIRDMAPTDRDRRLAEWRKDGRQALERADAMLFGSEKRGESADLFNRFARALAALAHVPGGVHFAGLVFCATHSPGGAATTQTAANRCQACLAAEQAADQPGDPDDGEEHP